MVSDSPGASRDKAWARVHPPVGPHRQRAQWGASSQAAGCVACRPCHRAAHLHGCGSGRSQGAHSLGGNLRKQKCYVERLGRPYPLQDLARGPTCLCCFCLKHDLGEGTTGVEQSRNLPHPRVPLLQGSGHCGELEYGGSQQWLQSSAHTTPTMAALGFPAVSQGIAHSHTGHLPKRTKALFLRHNFFYRPWWLGPKLIILLPLLPEGWDVLRSRKAKLRH